MPCQPITLARRIDEAISDAVRAAAGWLGRHLLRIWTCHLDKLASNAAYAAAAGAVVSGLLGFVPMREVVAAVLAAGLGVCINGARHGSPTSRGMDPWDVANGRAANHAATSHVVPCDALLAANVSNVPGDGALC